MRRAPRLRYFALWHVDPTKVGHEQELFFRLKNFLTLAAHYFDIKAEPELFMAERKSVLAALESMAPSYGLKPAVVSAKTPLNTNVPVLARHGEALILLLPYDHGNYRVYGAKQKYPALIGKAYVASRFAEVIELYLADSEAQKITLSSINARIQSFLPSSLIVVSSLFKVALLGLSVLAASLFFGPSRQQNIMAIAIAALISLLAAIILDIFIMRSAVKNMPIERLWSLLLLYKRAFTLSLPEYVRTTYSDILALRKSLNDAIARYFSRAPILANAWALLALNGLLLLFVHKGAALFLFALTLLAAGGGFLSDKRKRTIDDEESEALKKSNESLQSIEASFAMAASLQAVEPLMRPLQKAAENLEKTRRVAARFNGYLYLANLLVPLWFMTLVAILQDIKHANPAAAILLIFDALLIGAALMELVKPWRGPRPLDATSVVKLNNLHKTSGVKIKPLDVEGGIELGNVSFAYPDNGLLVFKNLSLSIEAGQRFAITGPSGSGKTTLLRLMMTQIEPDQGQIIFDGQDAKSLALIALRQHFGVVAQGSSLIAGSILENIMCGRQLSEERLIHLLYSHAIYDSLLDMPMGLQTYVFPNGHNLSRTQTIVTLLARALIHSPKILFMDEIFKGVPVNEQIIIKDYLTSLTMTRIIVSHHPLDDMGCEKVLNLT